MINENYITEARAILEYELSLDMRAGEEWMKILAFHIDNLVQNDFRKLVEILYRLDVDESRVRKILKEHSGEDAGNIIAGLIFERQLKILESRQSFSGKNTHIDEDEKW